MQTPPTEDIDVKMSLLPSKVFKHTIGVEYRLDEEWEGDVHVIYGNLNLLQRYFILWEYESSSYASFVLSICMALTVMLNIISFFLSTEYVYSPSTCDSPVCSNDATLCPGRTICEPIPLDLFSIIDDVCLYIFTIDYLSRMLTCWTVSPRLAQLTEDPLDNRSKLYQVFTYFFRFGNIIDLISVLPFYAYWIEYGIKNHQMSSFMRILRIPRLLRILNVSKRFSTVNVIIQIMSKTMQKSFKALAFTLFFVGLGVLVMASVMYTLEQGVFVVTTNYSMGAYLREDPLGTHTSFPNFLK